jgi:hypothetical protein
MFTTTWSDSPATFVAAAPIFALDVNNVDALNVRVVALVGAVGVVLDGFEVVGTAWLPPPPLHAASATRSEAAVTRRMVWTIRITWRPP